MCFGTPEAETVGVMALSCAVDGLRLRHHMLKDRVILPTKVPCHHPHFSNRAAQYKPSRSSQKKKNFRARISLRQRIISPYPSCLHQDEDEIKTKFQKKPGHTFGAFFFLFFFFGKIPNLSHAERLLLQRGCASRIHMRSVAPHSREAPPSLLSPLAQAAPLYHFPMPATKRSSDPPSIGTS